MRPADIGKAVDYIEENIAGKLDVAALSCACFVSPAQLYRDFYSETGHTVKEYIRKRRLSRALALVKTSDMPLSAVAAEYGYSSQQAFCKCVRSALGMTPLAYRDDGGIYFFPRYSGAGIHPVAVSAVTFPALDRLDVYHASPRGLEKRALDVLSALLPGYDGRIFGRNGPQQGGAFCYELYIERRDNRPDTVLTAPEPTAFVPAALADGLYAQTAVRPDDASIERAWDYLYTEWLRTSMFEQAETPYFEEYIRRNGKIARLRLFLPVRKRDGYDRITLRKQDDMLFLVSRAAGADAEEKASGAVIGFLSGNYPSLLSDARQFYVARSGGAYTCGVGLKVPLPVPEGGGLFNLRIEGGDYAVLEGSCTGDSAAFESVLRAWVRETGYTAAGAVFAVYETDGGFGMKHVRTKVFARIKK